ncbi:hypothetical protein ACFL5V_13080 [Fibrobacterota bacterium]
MMTLNGQILMACMMIISIISCFTLCSSKKEEIRVMSEAEEREFELR